MKLFKIIFMLIGALFSLESQAELCRYSKVKSHQSCEEGQIFGAIDKPLRSAVAHKAIAKYCNHRFTINVIKPPSTENDYLFSCIYKLNLNLNKNAQVESLEQGDSQSDQ